MLERLAWIFGLGLLAALALDDFSLRRQARAGVVYWHGPQSASDKKIAFTFDDGPNEPYTSEMLAVLKENGAKATFFLVGRNVEREPATAKKVVEAGHEIGNHSYSHADLLLESDEQVGVQLEATQNAIGHATGLKPKLFRPPHGFEDALTLRVARKKGYTVIKWSISSKDWTRPGVEKIVERVMERIQPGSIILMHDGNECFGGDRSQSVEALKLMLPKLKAQGYELVTVSELLSLK